MSNNSKILIEFYKLNNNNVECFAIALRNPTRLIGWSDCLQSYLSNSQQRSGQKPHSGNIYFQSRYLVLGKKRKKKEPQDSLCLSLNVDISWTHQITNLTTKYSMSGKISILIKTVTHSYYYFERMYKENDSL